jgi:hypothetical protein
MHAGHFFEIILEISELVLTVVAGLQKPERWNLPLLFTVSSMLGAVACGSSLLLLWVI